ncbi:maleylpyruvate isomerase family mycothiol-dependent enzyme [Amycolatopsis sp. NPDC051903]|uniref:maleylpyruvate isomerase family mycothiol-dependent enzyme n=1 Tax=Amycolatopsis sp. NPDC051903 TaxID=3363936 RepID=UPI0037A7398D
MTSQEPSAADVMTLAVQERSDFAGFLETLTLRQWEAPSLCGDWTVRDVVAHVISYEELSWAGVVKRFARGGFALSRANEIGIREYSRSPRELIDLLHAHQRPRGLTAVRSGMIALLDATIHHQDIRRPLGLPREIPHDRLRTALRLALTAPPIGAPKRARGLTLVATDVGWSRGSGPEVRGPGEALLMALAGRGDTLGELSGPGQALLAERI